MTKNNSDFNFIKIRKRKMPPKMIIIILKEQTTTNYEFSIFLLKVILNFTYTMPVFYMK